MGEVMLPVILLFILPCIDGQGFQSSIVPNWGQIGGSAANQERLLESLINRGWTPPPDVQRELAAAAQNRRAVTGGDGFGNRFDFGFTPEQLTAPGLRVEDLIPTNGGGRIGNLQDAGAANSLASLPNSVDIPGSLTRGLVNRGLMNPALVNPNLGRLVDPTLQGTGFIDPTLQGRRGFQDPTLAGTGFMDPTVQGRGLNGPSLLDAALTGRPRTPGMINIGPDSGLLGPIGPSLGPIGSGIDPLDPIGPGVIGIAGHNPLDLHHDHEHHLGLENPRAVKAVKDDLVKNKITKRKIRKLKKLQKKAKKVDEILKKEVLRKEAIGHTNGKIVAHGDHFHLDDKVLKVVGTSHTHHPPPPRKVEKPRNNPIKSLVQGLLLGGIGALLGK